MLRQQSILPLLQLLRLFNQASSTLQLALADLLDVNLIGSLNSLLQYQHQLARWQEETLTSARRRVRKPAQDSAKG